MLQCIYMTNDYLNVWNVLDDVLRDQGGVDPDPTPEIKADLDPITEKQFGSGSEVVKFTLDLFKRNPTIKSDIIVTQLLKFI